jgi:hypothetical protein
MNFELPERLALILTAGNSPQTVLTIRCNACYRPQMRTLRRSRLWIEGDRWIVGEGGETGQTLCGDVGAVYRSPIIQGNLRLNILLQVFCSC